MYIDNPAYAYRIDMYRNKLETLIIHEDDESPYAVKERINIMRINMKLNQLCSKLQKQAGLSVSFSLL